MTLATNTSNHEVMFSAFGYSDVGRQRKNNEDAFLVADLNAGLNNHTGGFNPHTAEHWLGERGALLVVADGMGGAAAGEVASALAVATTLFHCATFVQLHRVGPAQCSVADSTLSNLGL